MRHLASVILGPVLGFAAYILFGFGAGRLSIDDGWSSDNIVGVLAILAAGVAYAILVVPRLSPIGPALAGVAYLGVGLWIVSDVSSFVDVVKVDLFGLDNAGVGPGVLSLALAIPLLATLVSPNRWTSSTRRAAQPVGGPAPFGGQPEPPPFGGAVGAGAGAGFGGGAPGSGFGPPEPPPFGGQPAYGAPPLGNPYSGPPSFGSPPGSPVAPSGYDPYGTPPPSSGPPDPLRPDVTRRLQ